MQFNEKSNTIRWFIIVASFLIVLLILWNTYIFFQIFKNEERIKMELWVKALKTVNKADLDDNIELPSEIISNNTSIPIIITNKEGKIIKSANIDEQIVNDSIQLTAFLDKLKSQNKPLKLFLFDKEYQLIYYGDSSLINQLKYYPVALFLIILLFGAVVYNFYRATKMATQNKLWAAMA
ncbi:MAG TPA: two-component sensor histidine kinase, partial [Flavobacterium sp.]|nr:two-component sensor histidine kinase [Flavobacterium sp.]